MFSQDQLFMLLMLAHYIRRSTRMEWSLAVTQYVTTYYACFERDKDGKPITELKEADITNLLTIGGNVQSSYTHQQEGVVVALFNAPMGFEVKQFDDYSLAEIRDLINVYAPSASKDIEYNVMYSYQRNFDVALSTFSNSILGNVGNLNPYTYGVTNEIEPRLGELGMACDIILDKYLEQVLKALDLTSLRRASLATCSYDDILSEEDGDESEQ